MACNNPPQTPRPNVEKVRVLSTHYQYHDISTNPPYPTNVAQEDVTERCQPFIQDAVHRYEDRHQELDERERLLVNKTGIMERCIPALMAMKLWQTCEGKDPVSALEKVRELMKELMPQPDPADELVAQLEDQVDQLNKETAELHDKIIKADVELEEGKMELESLELVNCELEEQIKCMEAKICVSLESINSDDRLCLAEIRKLGENEKRMKKNIKQLEERETALRTQIERIFGGGCQKVCDSVQGQKHHAHRSRSHRKKDCQKLERTVEALFERDKARGKNQCGKLDKVAEKKNSMVRNLKGVQVPKKAEAMSQKDQFLRAGDAKVLPQETLGESMWHGYHGAEDEC
ncbi:golgin subfamily A member 6-like protein 10 [Copidosoma floridanum]|uniref:golgin subfamily A member 6-like protein 10 n=1 Tax=Copidosoma floridanum TaxID=29053 RepID=UPI0006C9A96E|nr:golgin subfamily A member 6-like protein 10 [Copidosoma floridanum]